MKNKKILWVVGTRPNFVKMFKHDNQVVVHTGQHYDDNMSKVFFDKMNIPKPKYNLGCSQLGEIIDKLNPILIKEKPDYVLVVGDTNSSLAGALAAVYLHIPVIHLEAGMRSGNREMPEEINRILIDEVSNFYLCSSETAAENLRKEGKVLGIYNVGSNILDRVLDECPTKEIKRYPKNTYRVLTLHRQSNVDNKENLQTILESLGETKEFILWPLHPRTKKMIKRFKLKIPDNIKVLRPLDHKKMISLMGFAKQVITDSGGIQVECYFLLKPCVTIRTETEWIETVFEGWNCLTGVNKDKIINAVKNHLPLPSHPNSRAYGMGQSNEIIKECLKNL